MTRLWLATCDWLADGGDEAVLASMFAERGITADWAVWDDPAVDWGAADLVAIRTTWDYTSKLDAFLAWTRHVAQATALVNAPAVVAWNTDKAYLSEIPAWGLPTVPTQRVTDAGALADALAVIGPAVVKPAVGLAGDGLVVWSPGDEVPEVGVPQVVQPLVESVRTDGEMSVYVIAGAVVAQIVKRPAEGEVRVHEHRGGRYASVELDPALTEMAERAIAEVSTRLAAAVPYGRVDFLRHEGSWMVSELELIEPSLYVGAEPRLAVAYVDAIADILDTARP